MTQKVEGLFYPLQHDEWIRACQELTPAQRDVLYFIRTLNPYGNGLEINCALIARELSGKRFQVRRQTVFRAIKKLEVKGFIEPGLYLKADGRSHLEDQIQGQLQEVADYIAACLPFDVKVTAQEVAA